MADSDRSGWERLDPDARQVAEVLAASMSSSLQELGVEAARQLLATAPRTDPITPLRVDEVTVPTRAGARRARHYRADHSSDSARPALLYLHGGGFVLGTLDGVDEVCRAISARSGWDVISLEYRLAPEHPYPAALEDSLDTFGWLRSSADELGIDPDVVAVGGDSAGGNLAAAICLHLRDHGDALPSAQVLVYPAVDDQFATPSWTEFAHAPVLNSADARWCWEQYVGPDPNAVDRYAAPTKADSLRGLPSALIITAEVDPLRDDGEAYAERLRQDGVSVTRVRYPGIFHGFFTEVGMFKQTEAAIDEVVRHLGRV